VARHPPVLSASISFRHDTGGLAYFLRPEADDGFIAIFVTLAYHSIPRRRRCLAVATTL